MKRRKYPKGAGVPQPFHEPESWPGKVSKAEADYGPGHQGSKCGICTYYQTGTCTVVAGNISPEMWCKYFRKA